MHQNRNQPETLGKIARYAKIHILAMHSSTVLAGMSGYVFISCSPHTATKVTKMFA